MGFGRPNEAWEVLGGRQDTGALQALCLLGRGWWVRRGPSTQGDLQRWTRQPSALRLYISEEARKEALLRGRPEKS